MSLDDISIKVATDLKSIGSVDALLNEIATRLELFIATGESSMIDLKSLPFSPAEYEALRTALGRGEVSARLETIGDSELYETHYAGVWWVTHYNVEGDVIADLHSIGSVDALLNEIATRLQRFVTTGETALIDLKGLPFSPAEYEGLRTMLGRGEISARLEAIGDSELYETHYPGVWWVTHYNVEGDVIADLLEIAAVPAILHSQPEDVQDGLERLQHTLSQNK